MWAFSFKALYKLKSLMMSLFYTAYVIISLQKLKQEVVSIVGRVVPLVGRCSR